MLDIARQAGVSKSTVSRAIHRPELVSPETRQKIYQIIESSDYVYDAVAGDMSKKRTSVIGLTIPTIRSSIFSASTHGIQEKAQSEGYWVIMGKTNYIKELELDLIRLFRQRRAAGLILTGLEPWGEPVVRDLTDQGVPVVVIWQKANEPGINFVGFDNHRAAFTVTNYLLELKHRRVGMIAGMHTKIFRVSQRLQGYKDALAKHGVTFDPQLIVAKEYSLLDGKEAMHRLLSLDNPPTAVFAASDALAMGALSAAKERGLNVPRDISIAGYDDIEFAAYTDPPLTTVRIPAYEMGKLAAKVLLQILRSGSQEVQQYCLETDLIIRGSCREYSKAK